MACLSRIVNLVESERVYLVNKSLKEKYVKFLNIKYLDSIYTTMTYSLAKLLLAIFNPLDIRKMYIKSILSSNTDTDTDVTLEFFNLFTSELFLKKLFFFLL